MRIQALAVTVATCVASLSHLPLSAPLLAQAPTPLSNGNLARISPTLYFSDGDSERKSREQLHAQVGAVQRRIAAATRPTLDAELDRAWALDSSLQRHAAYLKVQSLENSEQQSWKDAEAAVETDQAAIRAAIAARLQRVPPSEIAGLQRYAFLAKTTQAQAAHALPPAVESYRGAVTDRVAQDAATAYDQLIDSLRKPATVASLDLAARRSALAESSEAYETAAPSASTLLATIVDLENRDAMAQGFRNAAERKYASLGLDAEAVNRVLASVASQASVYRRYQQLLAEHARQKLDLPKALSSDVALASAPVTYLSFSDGQRLILDALQPLGSDYTNRFAQLLDPANGRLDLAGGTHRAAAGTSIEVYDAPVALYLSGYDGSLLKLSTIAHEGGHAIHRELMNAGGGPIYEREGPHFLFEGFAIFNELLLLDHAIQAARTPQEHEYALERLLAKISGELFVSAEETSFEQQLYAQGIPAGQLDRTRIDALYRNSIAPYEYWPMDDVGTSRAWMRKSLLFEDPLYLVNYLYAALVAVALYDRSHSDPRFGEAYEALLRRGFDADPQTLLASLGIRLGDPDLVASAVRLFTARTEELQALYFSASSPR